MLNSLKKAFSTYTITKERGQQDGPDFPPYSLKHGTKEVLFFAMEWEDPLTLDRIIVKEPLVKDKYGLKVGDGYDKIKKLRSS